MEIINQNFQRKNKVPEIITKLGTWIECQSAGTHFLGSTCICVFLSFTRNLKTIIKLDNL